jgi:hypothetical protein
MLDNEGKIRDKRKTKQNKEKQTYLEGEKESRSLLSPRSRCGVSIVEEFEVTVMVIRLLNFSSAVRGLAVGVGASVSPPALKSNKASSLASVDEF